MKVLVFAHTPPPLHGQSQMVKLLVEGFGGNRRSRSPGAPNVQHQRWDIACYHVNARVSKHLEDIGELRVQKFLLMLWYCAEAIWCRFRYGVTTLYYIPAPGKKSALYRDWMVMALCRPFFRKLVLHWQASGLAKWLETSVQIRTRSITFRLMKHPDLSIVLSEKVRGDAEKLYSSRVAVIANAISDPCPDFALGILPRRSARSAARGKLMAGAPLSPADLQNAGENPGLFRVLYMAHCTRDKGVFDAIDGVALANARLLAESSHVRVHLTIAGGFLSAHEEQLFQTRLGQPDLLLKSGRPEETEQRCATYAGFVSGDAKKRLFSESDCFCFPTYYYAEASPVVLVEALAYGLPVVTTRWRSIPDVVPQDFDTFVDIKSPDQIATTLLTVLKRSYEDRPRQHFIEKLTAERHLADVAAALRSTIQE